MCYQLTDIMILDNYAKYSKIKKNVCANGFVANK